MGSLVIAGRAVVQRRSPLDELSLSGALMPFLWGAVGAALLLAGVAGVDGGRAVLLGVGLLVCVIAGVLAPLDWARVPAAFVRALPYAGVVLLAGTGVAAPRAYVTLTGVYVVALVWTGFALERIDVGLLAVLTGGSVLQMEWRLFGASTAGWHTGEVVVLLVTAGGVMNWLRRRLDEAAAEAVRAHAETAQVQELAQAEQHRAEGARAEQAAAQLAAQSRLQAQVAEQAGNLAGVASEVRGDTTAVAAAAEQMAQALSELTRTATATEEITATVVSQAGAAADVMRALESSSAQIMAASDVIQGIAEQTNLLALNATIESARAGESGRGFAVVANEVKDLARQSGNNADAITRTLAEVQNQVASAVARVGQITASMAELSAHHATLAGALEEQSAAVQQVSSNVQHVAGEVVSMTEGIRILEGLSRST